MSETPCSNYTEDYYFDSNSILRCRNKKYSTRPNSVTVNYGEPIAIRKLNRKTVLENSKVYNALLSILGWYKLNYLLEGNPIGRGDMNRIESITRWRADWGLFSGYKITDLGIANGGDTHNVDGDDGVEGKCMTQDAPSFVEALGQITDNVKEDEYMVVICTFAQGSTKHGDWRQEISDACANNEKVIDASTLGPNTVVGDVLGKVIVMVNTFTEGEVADSKCLYFNMGMTLIQSEFTSQPYYQIPILSDCIDPTNITLYGTHAQITTDGNSYYNDERGYVPSIEDRKVKIQNIWDWSKDNYAKETFDHNAWLYLGLGGYIPGRGGIFGTDDDPTTVGEQFGSWLTETVNSMETNADYYPMGMVLINHANTYSTTVRNILLMNNKYRKAYNPDLSPVTGKPIDGGVQSAAPGYSSGMTDNNTNAIGWTKVD